jgi:hypothetical protein
MLQLTCFLIIPQQLSVYCVIHSPVYGFSLCFIALAVSWVDKQTMDYARYL